MFSAINTALLLFWHYCHVYIWLYAIITSVLFGLYLKTTGVSTWYLGCIPAVNNISKWRAGVNPVLAIVSLLLDVFYLSGGGDLLVVFVVMLVHTIVDFLFAKAYCGCSAVQYACIPFVKYWFMYKEAIECKSTTKVKNTRKMSSKTVSSKKKVKKTLKPR